MSQDITVDNKRKCHKLRRKNSRKTKVAYVIIQAAAKPINVTYVQALTAKPV
jgi:hypothetical protein